MKFPYHIYIPTRNRVDKQTTVEKLPTGLHKHITLVCPREDEAALRANYPTVNVVVQPKNVKTIAVKRGWIAEYASTQPAPFWLQMDDDLSFFVWTGVKHTSLIHDKEATRKFFLEKLPELIGQYDCIGFGTKGFALPGGIRKGYHLGFVFGFSKKLAAKMEWTRVAYYEDIDYTLQVLSMRKGIAITYDMTVEQRKADAPGGISDERTLAKAEEALVKLMALHPGIVQRKPPSSKHPYSNTKVSWAKAAAQAHGKQNSTLF